LLTIQKKQAKYFAFRREKALVESGLNTLLFNSHIIEHAWTVQISVITPGTVSTGVLKCQAFFLGDTSVHFHRCTVRNALQKLRNI
jgi:hypothetical protein